ncbi:hypothetical protein B0T14DRAFT_504056 [Immersiella caudata]|uniref:Secreted protein n=1 Tax=Immersiella caudata TaxID=314043 RepID=A0AA39XEA9_9PEZI|nr:hypothetical protein B0T14DRAFT_504056 [Immersiella caudata]
MSFNVIIGFLILLSFCLCSLLAAVPFLTNSQRYGFLEERSAVLPRFRPNGSIRVETSAMSTGCGCLPEHDRRQGL